MTTTSVTPRLRASLRVLALLALLRCDSTPRADAGPPADVASADAPDAVADAPAVPRAECNPLGFPEACALPFPSAYYLREDPASATGVRVALAQAALPVTIGRITNERDRALDPSPWNRLDGFSPSAPMVVYFRERLDPASLVPPSDPSRSLAPGAATVLVDTETGERVLHFSEVDVTARADERQAVLIRPLIRLRPGHRYAVAVTRAARAMNGAAPASPPGFLALLAGDTARDARLAAVAARYPEVFAALARAGVAREELVLAWDFVTTSEQYLTGPTIALRDAALAAAGERGLGFTVTSVEDDFNARIQRRIRGTFRAPWYLSAAGPIERMPDGAPVAQGTRDVPFVAMVPRSAATRGPLPMVLFGHGIFGGAVSELGEAGDARNAMQSLADDLGYVVVATDWMGLSLGDLTDVLAGLSNLNHLPRVTDRLQQAIANAMVLYRTARARFAEAPEFQAGGRAALDPARAYYLGISGGAIMGGAFLGYSRDCDRAVLNVGGANWSLMVQRTVNYGALTFALGEYRAPDERQLVLAMMQSLFDPADPINVAPHLLRDRLPGVGERHLLLQMAVGDAAVSNLATEMFARTAALPVLLPAPRRAPGLAGSMAPLDSALTVWDTHPVPLPPETNGPVVDNPTHVAVRNLPALREQIRRFFAPTGRVEHTCDGPCDPE